MLLHPCLGTLTLFMSRASGSRCTAAGAMFLLWEMSSPFVGLRYFIHGMGRNDTKLYLYNGLTMMVVFFLCRNVLGLGMPRTTSLAQLQNNISLQVMKASAVHHNRSLQFDASPWDSLGMLCVTSHVGRLLEGFRA